MRRVLPSEGNDVFDDVRALSPSGCGRNRIAGLAKFRDAPPGGCGCIASENSGALGERLSNSLIAGGEPLAVLDMDVLQADLERLRLLYRQEGFFRSRGYCPDRYALRDRQGGGHVFHVTPGRAHLHTECAVCTGSTISDARAAYAAGAGRRTVRVEPVDSEDRPLRLRARRQRYSETMLHSEARRILTFLRDEGYRCRDPGLHVRAVIL